MGKICRERMRCVTLQSTRGCISQWRIVHFAMSKLSNKRATTLLFAHGSGFCQNVWTPIKERLSKTALFQQTPGIEMQSFDFPFHGTRRDVSEAATVHHDNPSSPRVTHPKSDWVAWARDDIFNQLQQIHALHKDEGKQTGPIIGIGHSMGATAMLATEIERPGTFDGLVLFEPICNLPSGPRNDAVVDFLVTVTLQRRSTWDSLEEARRDILTTKNFARWDPEILSSYIDGAVVDDPGSGSAVLSCDPRFEASLYSSTCPHFSLHDMSRVRCPISFQYGARTHMFTPQVMMPIIKKYPDRFSMAEPVPDGNHTLVMEYPDAVVDRIHDTLQALPAFSSPNHTSSL